MSEFLFHASACACGILGASGFIALACWCASDPDHSFKDRPRAVTDGPPPPTRPKHK